MKFRLSSRGCEARPAKGEPPLEGKLSPGELDRIAYRTERRAPACISYARALIEIVPHPNPAKYPRQKIMVVEVGGYAYLVPFVEEDDHFFLKTIIPSRRATRDFIAKESDDV